MSTISPGSITEVSNDTTNDAQVRVTPQPVDKAHRIETVDMIRGFALLGILMMNIPYFAFHFSIHYDVLHGPHQSKDYFALATVLAFFDGTMRGLFSMLFGAGMVLFLMNKKQQPGGPTVEEFYYRRLLWLVVFGLINGFVLQWVGDILFYYGFAGMLLYAFRNSRPKLLFGLALICALISAYKVEDGHLQIRETRLNYVSAIKAEKHGKTLTEKQMEDKNAWLNAEKMFTPNRERDSENIRNMQGTYLTATDFTHRLLYNFQIQWLYYDFIWDMLFMMLVGMAFFKMGFFSDKPSSSTYRLLLAIGYGLGLPIGYIYFNGSVFFDMAPGKFLDRYSVPPSILYDLRRILLCVGHVSLLMLVYRSRLVPWMMKALSNVGQMAFTNYLMQSIFCSFIFYGYGLGYYHKMQYHQIYYIVFAIWIFQLIFSSIWLKYYKFGPFEWTWRSLTYWKNQPMKVKG